MECISKSISQKQFYKNRANKNKASLADIRFTIFN